MLFTRTHKNKTKAAAYVRSATTDAKSINEQRARIQICAKNSNCTIVKTYEDFGKSGLDTTNRPSFLEMIEDIKNKNVNFSVLFLSDITRWGRFQNMDEVPYYENLCTQSGKDMPSSSAYMGRFGGLLRAYQLVGFSPERDYRYVEINKVLRRVHSDIFLNTVDNITKIGGHVEINEENDLLTINDMFTASLVICRCTTTSTDAYRWKVRFDTSLNPDITIAARMEANNEKILDYYLLPSLEFNAPNISLEENNRDLIDSFRFDDLDYLFEMARVVSISEAA